MAGLRRVRSTCPSRSVAASWGRPSCRSSLARRNRSTTSASAGKVSAKARNRKSTAPSSSPACCSPRISNKPARTSVGSIARRLSMAVLSSSARPAFSASSPTRRQRMRQRCAVRVVGSTLNAFCRAPAGSSMAASSAARSRLSGSTSAASAAVASSRRPNASCASASMRRRCESFGIRAKPRHSRLSHSAYRPVRRSSTPALLM